MITNDIEIIPVTMYIFKVTYLESIPVNIYFEKVIYPEIIHVILYMLICLLI